MTPSKSLDDPNEVKVFPKNEEVDNVGKKVRYSLTISPDSKKLLQTPAKKLNNASSSPLLVTSERNNEVPLLSSLDSKFKTPETSIIVKSRSFSLISKENSVMKHKNRRYTATDFKSKISSNNRAILQESPSAPAIFMNKTSVERNVHKVKVESMDELSELTRESIQINEPIIDSQIKPKAIPLPSLLTLIEEFFVSKEKSDMQSVALKLPRYSISEQVDQFLNQKYGLSSIVQSICVLL